MLYSLIKPCLFAMDAETAHEKTLALLHYASLLRTTPRLAVRPTRVMGLSFPNPVGLAAGLDKNGQYIDALGKLGFGFLEVGTVTPEPQDGNPKPRLFRLTAERAVINRMGFNNAGVRQLVENVKTARYGGVLGINIGKNKDTPNASAVTDYLACFEQVYEHADYITVNISSPNTQGLRDLQGGDSLALLVEMLKEAQHLLSGEFGYKPIAVKIAPDLDETQVAEIARIIKAADIDGVIATNTTLDRSQIVGSPHVDEAGGLSGAPLTEASTQIIRQLSAELGGAVPIIGVGGIMNAGDAKAKLQAGASLVQLYSGLIYQGPRLIKEILRAV